MDPRTFLPPPVVSVSPTPKPGDPAPPLPVEPESGRSAIVAFLRHPGCPFAERTMQRGSYAAWGLGRTSLGHFMGRRSLVAVATLARVGIRNRHPAGTRWQSAGTFALDGAGVVRWTSLPAHAGDLPDLDAALRSLR